MSPVATLESETICAQKLAAGIRAQRLRTGWSLEELAERAGVSRSTLHHLEHGTTQHPRLLTLHRLAKAFGVEVEELAPSGATWDFSGVGPAADFSSAEGSPASGGSREQGEWGEAAERARGKMAAGTGNSPGNGVGLGGVGPSGVAGGLAAVEPGLFRDWTWADWVLWETHLSSLGEAGLDRVREAACEVNRNRETRQQLQAVLRSPLAAVATQRIQTLFDTACRGALGGQVPPA
jgi:transcriptional regulator with XRE-family HTH domain